MMTQAGQFKDADACPGQKFPLLPEQTRRPAVQFKLFDAAAFCADCERAVMHSLAIMFTRNESVNGFDPVNQPVSGQCRKRAIYCGRRT